MTDPVNDTLEDHSFPPAMFCADNTYTLDDYTQQMIEECHEQALQDALLEENSINSTMLQDSLFNFTNKYQQACLNNLDMHESFAAVYTN